MIMIGWAAAEREARGPGARSDGPQLHRPLQAPGNFGPEFCEFGPRNLRQQNIEGSLRRKIKN